MAAGLQLKNLLTSKDENIKSLYQQRWLTQDNEVRVAVKLKASDLFLNIFVCRTSTEPLERIMKDACS